MNGALHEVPQVLVDQAMAGHGGEAGEGRGDDGQLVMAAAAAGTGMAGVAMGFIDEVELRRLQGRQALTDLRLDAHAGKTFLKGLTTTWP